MLTDDTDAHEATADLPSAAGPRVGETRRDWIARLAQSHIADAIATLEHLAGNARSPSARRTAERDLKRYRARAAKAVDKP